MNLSKNEKAMTIIAGVIMGVIGASLVLFGNPKNMGFCIACFLRDTAGGVGLHRAEVVQYIRPEIIGLIFGSLFAALATKEFSPRGGSAPMTRFVLGFFAMIGALMFLGCPFRMILRIASGDLNAIVAFVGFVCGIATGVFFLNRGYSLNRTRKVSKSEGSILPVIALVFLVLLVAAPAFIFFSEKGPGSMHAPLAISLIAGIIVGALAQRTRFCMVGGIRDMILFRENRLLLGFVAVLVSALVMNLIFSATTGTSYFNLGFENQPIAHSDGLWNFLGLYLTGFACVLLGGCPLRQLILSGEGNTDSAVTILGLFVGAAFAHNFGLAASGDGPTVNGMIAVVIGIVVVAVIALTNLKTAKE